jgi:glucose-6-phosphate isomerase
MIKLDYSKTQACVSGTEVQALQAKAMQSLALLHNKQGAGKDFLGWVGLPSSISSTGIGEINGAAQKICTGIDVVVVVGIGGSYLGAKAVIEALSHSFGYMRSPRPQIVFAGQNISEDYIYELLDTIKGKSVSCIVISKSGTTTEPALAFRFIKNYIEATYGKAEAARRIVAVTDSTRGALRTMAIQEGYQTFVIPDDVGGRFSVLTPVGLLPIACAGINIAELVRGAADEEKNLGIGSAFESNIAAQYAAVRNCLYSKGKKVEILANFNPKLHSFAEWWKQLYGESEGKDGKGIFPASVDFTTDLHSLGQYIQSGERILFETFLSVATTNQHLEVPSDSTDLDGLNYLACKRIDEVNKKASLGTQMAHADGGVPIINIEIPALTPYNLGALIYFFEKACGISGYMLGVNPFDQPGVEAYKKNMFALLGKAGYK